MRAHLQASLINKMEEWVEEQMEDVNWPRTYFGAETTRLMADAAAAVFDAVVEVQEYGLSEGFYEEPEC